MTSSLLCPLHPDTKPRQVLPGLHLCAWHVDGITEDLDDIAATWTGLLAAVDPHHAQGESGTRVSGTPEDRIPIDAHAVDVQVQVRRHVLDLATRLMLDSDYRPYSDEGTVPGLARWVGRHADWVARQDDARHVVETLRADLHDMRAVAYPSGTRVFDVAPCPVTDCAGRIEAVIGDEQVSVLRCSADRAHEWAADRWLFLGRQLRATA